MCILFSRYERGFFLVINKSICQRRCMQLIMKSSEEQDMPLDKVSSYLYRDFLIRLQFYSKGQTITEGENFSKLSCTKECRLRQVELAAATLLLTFCEAVSVCSTC